MSAPVIEADKRGFRAPGTTFMVAGGLIGAVGAYIFQVYGGRALGPEAFAPIGVLWTTFFILATVLLVPVEQYVTREVASGRKAIPHDLRPATVMALIGAVLGGGFAVVTLERLFEGSWQYILQIILLLPLVTPIVIIAIGVFFVYAKVGLLATIPGLVLANVMLGIPYVITAVLVGLRKFDPTQEMVARSLGMNRLRSFFVVTLPQIRPSVISGMLFAFISALDETVVALFIAGGENQTLTKRMFTALRDEIDPTIAAISSLLTAVSFLLVILIALNAREAKPVPEERINGGH